MVTLAHDIFRSIYCLQMRIVCRSTDRAPKRGVGGRVLGLGNGKAHSQKSYFAMHYARNAILAQSIMLLLIPDRLSSCSSPLASAYITRSFATLPAQVPHGRLLLQPVHGQVQPLL